MAPAPAPARTRSRTPAAGLYPARRGRTPRTGRAGTAAPVAPLGVWPVWPHRPDDPQSTVAALIGTYTRPRNRVLLLAPPAPAGSDAGWDWPAQLRTPGPALTRLRRRIQVRTAAPHPPSTDPVPEDRGPRPEPGPHARTCPPDPPDPPFAATRGPEAAGGPAAWTAAWTGCRPDTAGPHRAGPDRVGSDRVGSDRADLVVTAVDPHAPDWIAHLPWTGLLTRSGLLAVITYGDRRGRRWVDPLPVLTGLLTRAGLAWHDRIVLHHDLTEPRTAGRPEPGPEVRHERVHTELLLFSRARLSPVRLTPARLAPVRRSGAGAGGRDA